MSLMVGIYKAVRTTQRRNKNVYKKTRLSREVPCVTARFTRTGRIIKKPNRLDL